jgi:hypothetical protein
VEYTQHHDSIESLQRSALEDCEICRVLWSDPISHLSQLSSEHVQISTEVIVKEFHDGTGTRQLHVEANSHEYIREWVFICELAMGMRIPLLTEAVC